MDVNNTKFHLLLSRADWGSCKLAQSGELLGKIWKSESEGETIPDQQFDWNEETGEITLQPRLFKFTASPKDEKPNLTNRRGAARDRYGNWYWIDETGLKIKILSAGSNTVSDYYPVAAAVCAQEAESDFQPIEKSVPGAPSALHGLAVTIDHYLVVGTLEPKGLLIFDLFSVGEPRQILWRDDVDFTPFDIATRSSGGVFVLDRQNHRYWTLDRGFNTIPEKNVKVPETNDAFQPLDKSEKRKHSENLPAEKVFSELPPDEDPISIEALPDDTVLILNLPQDEDFSIIYRYYRGKKLDELTTASISSEVQEDEDDLLASPPKKFRLRGYDIAFVEAQGEETQDRLYIVTEEGNQAFAFRLVCKDELPVSPALDLPPYVVGKNFELQPVTEYFPMRLFSGKGFTTAGGKVYFDFGERWLPLIRQRRPLYVAGGTLETPVFDGKETNCVWHRLMLDGCISPETKVEIYTRTARTKSDLEQIAWQAEPKLYLRGNGSEQPFVRNVTAKEKGKGTWELLFQRAKGRYMQMKLVFSGNGQRTPRISAMRLYYPRFSYLDNYLPSVYREDEQSAFFLDRFLANFEGFYTTIEDKIAAVQMLFDVRSAPPDALDWLANWFGVALDPAWKDEKRRLFIRHAVDFFQYRGTVRGLRIALRLALDSCADESLFDTKTSEEKIRDPIRIVEKFLTRRTPEIIPADFVEEQNLPRITQETSRWTPAQGADVLHQRYREALEKSLGNALKLSNIKPGAVLEKLKEKLNLKPHTLKPDEEKALAALENLGENSNVTFPLIKPTDAKEAPVWESFALEMLGFVPSTTAASERQNWQSFLRSKYLNEIKKLNDAHGTKYTNFDGIFLPHGTETNTALLADWQDFLAQTTDSSRNRKLWQDFLARRYRRVGQLNNFYGTKWSSFEVVSLFDELPTVIKALVDWYQFESAVLAMHRTAHRFTVLIPATLSGEKPETPEEQSRKLELVRRLVELEKPAHTICDYRYYWNLFRLEEVRLGTDTLLGLGSRDPLLNPSLVVGEGYVGESRLGLPQPEKYSSRYVLGSENLIKQKKKKDEEL